VKRAKVISRCDFSPKKSTSRNRKLKALVYDLSSSPAGVEVSRATLGVSNEAKLEGDSEIRKLFLFFLDCSSNGPLVKLLVLQDLNIVYTDEPSEASKPSALSERERRQFTTIIVVDPFRRICRESWDDAENELRSLSRTEN